MSGDQIQFNLDGAPGIYYVQIIADNRVDVVKVIKH